MDKHYRAEICQWAIGIVLIAMTTPAGGADIIDQVNVLDPDDNGLSAESVQSVGQTFHPLASGFLTGVDLDLFRDPIRSGVATLELRPVLSPPAINREVTLGAQLFSTTISLARISETPVFQFVHVPFAPTALTADQEYALILSCEIVDRDGPDPVSWHWSSIDSYSRGESLVKPQAFGWTGIEGDLAFKTYMSEVPEPGPIVLMSIGMGCMAGCFLRRSLATQKGLRTMQKR
jgi:hypothetical protein